MSNTNNRLQILKVLLRNKNQTVSGQELSELIDVSRQAIFKIVKNLREEGLMINAVKGEGYIFSGFEDDCFSPLLTEALLSEQSVFKKCLYSDTVDSTQKALKQMIHDYSDEALVYVSENQTAGRGRLDRSWEGHPYKDLTFSMLIHPKLKPSKIQILNLLIGSVIKKLLERKYKLDCELKWPNDILVNGKKICGILSEAACDPDRIYYAICGVGININTDTYLFSDILKENATSIKNETGIHVNRSVFLADLLNMISDSLLNINTDDDINKFLDEYRCQCDTLNKNVLVSEDDTDLEGIATAITDNGSIVIKTENGEKIFSAADIKHIRKK